jgi:hypothetical protein
MKNTVSNCLHLAQCSFAVKSIISSEPINKLALSHHSWCDNPNGNTEYAKSVIFIYLLHLHLDLTSMKLSSSIWDSCGSSKFEQSSLNNIQTLLILFAPDKIFLGPVK